MTAKEIREKYLKFFKSKQHQIIPSASLIPENDPTVLFTTAGMHPLVPYLLGQPHPLGKRLCNVQKCLRTDDIDDVGDNTHLTFFEMLGNWSLGDYFKKEAIEWSFEFLTQELKIPLQKLAFSVFEGEAQNHIPRDEESAQIWQSLGVPKERIAYLGRNDNWWGPAGKTGPCGPDTEMFYWVAQEPAPLVFDPNNKNWVEIWNDVFMQYNKKPKNQSAGLISEEKEEYEFVPLQQKNVDTGMGLERISATLQGKASVYETELFAPIINEIKKLKAQNAKLEVSFANAKLEQEKAIRIIADHLKAATFLLAEKLEPSNTERGYILRRLIRRAVRYGKLLGIEREYCAVIAEKVIEIYHDVYTELKENQGFILEKLAAEERKFMQCLDRGLKILHQKALSANQKTLKGEDAFYIYETFGFPPELIKEECSKIGTVFDEKGFAHSLQRHQELSRTATAGQFRSGLADDSAQTIKYHTATHLLLAALREVLGKEIQQKGSNITSERLRFDFNFPRKLTTDELAKIENLVNAKIQEGCQVLCEEMSTEQAFAGGATGVFGHKYPPKVRVYSILGKDNHCFSKEICSGPHVANTSELGKFQIIKEESLASGVRRIKAILK